MDDYLEQLSQPLDQEHSLNQAQSKFLLDDCGKGEVYRGLVARYGRVATYDALSTFIAPQVVRIQLSILCPEAVDVGYNRD